VLITDTFTQSSATAPAA